MNCNQNSGCSPRRPGIEPTPCQNPCQRPVPYSGIRPNMPPAYSQRPDDGNGFIPQGPGPVILGQNQSMGFERFPIGMGYVPMQKWETPFPMERGFRRGTIFPSLDYPFVMGRCRE